MKGGEKMGNVIELKESGYRKIFRKCRDVNASSNENDLRNVLQVISSISELELKKESNATATNETV